MDRHAGAHKRRWSCHRFVVRINIRAQARFTDPDADFRFARRAGPADQRRLALLDRRDINAHRFRLPQRDARHPMAAALIYFTRHAGIKSTAAARPHADPATNQAFE
ncbi:hypothetical protein G3N57_07980 [Paraburkholderia sp. Se-20369]|nr:hypothetical protein [Paraburkholderia sp. Se-20369]